MSKKGLTTVPRKIREQLGLEEGDRLLWRVVEENGERAALVKALSNPYQTLRGRRRAAELTYERVEELADRLVSEEARR